MLAYALGRLLRALFTLFCVTVILFASLRIFAPNEWAARAYGMPRLLAREGIVICTLQLDRPFHVEYLMWLRGHINPGTGKPEGGILHGDMGYSRTASQPVMAMLAHRFPATVELVLAAMVLFCVGGLALGALVALIPNRFVALVQFLSLGSASFPPFLVGLLLLMLVYPTLDNFPFGRLAPWAAQVVNGPTWQPYTHLIMVDALLNGRLDVGVSALRHLLAPALTLSYLALPLVARFTHGSLMAALRQERMRATDASRPYDSILPLGRPLLNLLLSVATIAGTTVGSLLSGAIIVETLFAYPGIGQITAQAASQLDVATLLSLALIFSLTLLLTHLLVDFASLSHNPRAEATRPVGRWVEG